MHQRRSIFVILFVGLFALVCAGDQQPASKKIEPCWEQAGISKSVMEERKSIQESTRSQVQAVCSETNLTEQQKREKIRQIRRTAQEKVNAIISPAEREQLETCQRARHASSPHTGGHPAGGDPCAGLGQ
jgi:apolipoprotein N-acyltransferase